MQPLVESLGPLTEEDLPGDLQRVVLPLLREWLPLLSLQPSPPAAFVQGAAGWPPRPAAPQPPAAVWAALATLLPLLTDPAVLSSVLRGVPGLPDAVARQLQPASPVLWQALGCWTPLWAGGVVRAYLSQPLPVLLDAVLHVCRRGQERLWHRGMQAAWAMLRDCHGVIFCCATEFCWHVAETTGTEPDLRRVLLRFLLHELPRQCTAASGAVLSAQHLACTLLLDGLNTRTPSCQHCMNTSVMLRCVGVVACPCCMHGAQPEKQQPSHTVQPATADVYLWGPVLVHAAAQPAGQESLKGRVAGAAAAVLSNAVCMDAAALVRQHGLSYLVTALCLHAQMVAAGQPGAVQALVHAISRCPVESMASAATAAQRADRPQSDCLVAPVLWWQGAEGAAGPPLVCAAAVASDLEGGGGVHGRGGFLAGAEPAACPEEVCGGGKGGMMQYYMQYMTPFFQQCRSSVCHSGINGPTPGPTKTMCVRVPSAHAPGSFQRSFARCKTRPCAP